MDGGYVEYMLVPNYMYLVEIGDDVNTDTSASLSCADLAAYGAVNNVML